MSVAMASCGKFSGLCGGLKVTEKQALSGHGISRRFFAVDPFHSVCIPPRRSGLFASTIIPKTPSAVVEDKSFSAIADIPTPKVMIDLDSDPDSTLVEITFGDRLGTLLDTMSALQNLGLSVVKANTYLDSSGRHNKFAITELYTGKKIEDPELLEAIRLTIINNMLQYHPESSSQLAMGEAFGVFQPYTKDGGTYGPLTIRKFKKSIKSVTHNNQRTIRVDVDIATHVHVYDDGPERSLLRVETVDRPGLLVDLVKTIADINIDVESGEFETEGLLAKAKFHASYRGKALFKPLQQVLENSLRYFLRRPTTEDASF